ncbi:MAG: DUF433 domain-containing protein [Candidatus Micrarchaeota archaeon]|nr:DUF433 domain-containing protein [Candidatus Micrarchaeota archaeon]
MESRIVFNPEILSGKPIVKGTRISVELILEWLASGMSTEEIVKEYPHLKRADILAAVTYAAKALKHEELVIIGK